MTAEEEAAEEEAAEEEVAEEEAAEEEAEAADMRLLVLLERFGVTSMAEMPVPAVVGAEELLIGLLFDSSSCSRSMSSTLLCRMMPWVRKLVGA